MSSKKSGVIPFLVAIGAGGLSFAINKAISKADSIQKMGKDKYPGLVPFMASSAMTGGAVALRNHVKDEKIRAGVIIGNGIASFERLLNVDMIKKNLPQAVQTLLSGEEDPTIIKVTPKQLEQIVQTETERNLRQMTQTPEETTTVGSQTQEVVTEENLEGEDFEYRTVNGDDDTEIFR